MTLKSAKQGKLVPSDTSTGAIAYRFIENFNPPAPGGASILIAIHGCTKLLCTQQGSEVTAVERTDAPGWRRGIRLEDLPGDLAGDHFGGLVQITREQGPGRDASSRLGVVEIDRHLPASGSSFDAIDGMLGRPWQSLTQFFKEVSGRREVGRLNPNPDPVPAGIRL